jgi:hypothetical protein
MKDVLKALANVEADVRKVIAEATSASELTQKLFGAKGVFVDLGQTEADRQKISHTPLYKAARDRLSELRSTELTQFKNRVDAIEMKRKVSRLTMNVPGSLYDALKDEARGEGVSLSELVRLKVSVPYKTITQCMLNPTGGEKKTAKA